MGSEPVFIKLHVGVKPAVLAYLTYKYPGAAAIQLRNGSNECFALKQMLKCSRKEFDKRGRDIYGHEIIFIINLKTLNDNGGLMTKTNVKRFNTRILKLMQDEIVYRIDTLVNVGGWSLKNACEQIHTMMNGGDLLTIENILQIYQRWKQFNKALSVKVAA